MTLEFYWDFNPPDMLFIHDGCALCQRRRINKRMMFGSLRVAFNLLQILPLCFFISDESRSQFGEKFPVSRCLKGCSCSSPASPFKWSSQSSKLRTIGGAAFTSLDHIQHGDHDKAYQQCCWLTSASRMHGRSGFLGRICIPLLQTLQW